MDDLDDLTVLGLVAITAMVVFYALEDRGPRTILAFAGACALASIASILQDAWLFGIVQAIWAGVALQRWRKRVG